MRDKIIASRRYPYMSSAVLMLIFFLCGSGYANTLMVTNTADGGTGSFRQAILDANAIAGTHTIIFNIPASDSGFNGSVFTIKPLSELPVVRNTTIDGSTQST